MINRRRSDRYSKNALDSLKEDIMNDMRLYEEMEGKPGPGARGSLPRREREFEDYRRSRATARRDLMQELKAMQAMENRHGGARDPQVRELAREIVLEAKRNHMSLNEVMYALKGPGWKERLGTLPGGGLTLGLAALAAILLLPGAGSKLRGMTGKIIEEAMELSEKAQTLVEKAREEVEDIVAEAQFKRFKDALGPDDPEAQQ